MSGRRTSQEKRVVLIGKKKIIGEVKIDRHMDNRDTASFIRKMSGKFARKVYNPKPFVGHKTVVNYPSTPHEIFDLRFLSLRSGLGGTHKKVLKVVKVR